MEANVLYSPEYRHFALWLGVESGSQKGHRVTAVSKHPTGPFEAVSWEVPGLHTGNQFETWRDDASGAVYAAINMKPGFSDMPLAVVQLSPDLLSVMPNQTSAPIRAPASAWQPVLPHASAGPRSVGRLEGGGIFQHGGRWFVMSGATCCFCKRGSNGFVWVSDKPLGPYTYVRDIIGWNSSTNTFVTGAQQFGVVPLYAADGQVIPLYVGQRAGSADDGRKCHDYAYWQPLTFDADGMPNQIVFTPQISVDIAVGR